MASNTSRAVAFTQGGTIIVDISMFEVERTSELEEVGIIVEKGSTIVVSGSAQTAKRSWSSTYPSVCKSVREVGPSTETTQSVICLDLGTRGIELDEMKARWNSINKGAIVITEIIGGENNAAAASALRQPKHPLNRDPG